jgi:hypothetical protein
VKGCVELSFASWILPVIFLLEGSVEGLKVRYRLICVKTVGHYLKVTVAAMFITADLAVTLFQMRVR